MKRRTIGRVAIVVFLAGLSCAALAQPRRPHGRMGPGGQWWNNPQTIDALQLDGQTRDMIEQEVHSTKMGLITLKGEVERAELELQRMLRTEPMPSSGEIEGQVDSLVQAQGNVMKQEILLRARILSLLTPEQRTELESLHQQRREAVRREFRNRSHRSPAPPEPPAEPNL